MVVDQKYTLGGNDHAGVGLELPIACKRHPVRFEFFAGQVGAIHPCHFQRQRPHGTTNLTTAVSPKPETTFHGWFARNGHTGKKSQARKNPHKAG